MANTHLPRVREIADEISRLALELGQESVKARDAGASWGQIAAAARGHWGTGKIDALGNMLPGGTSITTIRQWVESRRI